MAGARRYAEFYRQWAAMQRAGLPMQRALSTFAKSGGPLAPVIKRLADHIMGGDSLTEAMERERRHFHFIDRALVAAGERSGRLDGVLVLLADWKEAEARMLRTMLSGLAYPAILLHFAAFILPFATRIGGAMSGGAFDYSGFLSEVAMILFPCYIVAGLGWALRSPALRETRFAYAADALLLRIPLLGTALWNLALSRYVYAYHALYEAGTPAAETAAMAEQACGNRPVARAMAGGRRAAEDGEPFSTGLVDPGIPMEVKVIWSTAEEAGSLHTSLPRLAGQLRDRAEYYFAQLSEWLPRLVYFGIALFVGYMIVRFWATFYGSMLSGDLDPFA